MPSTRIQFRLPAATYAALKKWASSEGKKPDALARELVIERMGEDPMPKPAEQEAGAGTRPAPTKPPPAEPVDADAQPRDITARTITVENPLQRATRLKGEWEELERDHPSLAREVGSYDEYARRNG